MRTKLAVTMITMLFVVLLFSSTAWAHPTTDGIDIIIPEKAFYYGGHTYVQYWIPDASWEYKRDFCIELGKMAGVPAHLVYIKNEGIDNQLSSHDVRGIIGAFENGDGYWRWLDGTPMGRMVPVQVPDEYGNLRWDFRYDNMGAYDGWCKGAEVAHATYEKREPDAFSAPMTDQHYAHNGSEFGWHNHFEEPLSFICEFEGEVTFALAMENANLEYNRYNSPVILSSPSVFANVNGKLTAIPIKNEILKKDGLIKQSIGKYPVHPEREFNFHGWSYYSKKGQNELFGNKTAQPMKIWDYTSTEPFTEKDPLDPLLFLYAVWEDAHIFNEETSFEAGSTYLALDQFVYLISADPNETYKGKTVAEMLNKSHSSEMDKMRDNRPHRENGTDVAMIDFLYAKIGGWTISDWRAGDKKSDEGGWSFFAAKVNNRPDQTALVYEGTAFADTDWALVKDSVGTDVDFGLNGKFNSQFRQALEFYRDFKSKDGKTFAVGHSLGGGLAAHVAYTFGINAHTYNGVEGWTLPISVRQNYLLRDFPGVDALDNIDSWCHVGDVLVGIHEREKRSRWLIEPKDLHGIANAHEIFPAVAYRDGIYSVADAKFKNVKSPWVWRTVSLGLSKEEVLVARSGDVAIRDGDYRLFLFGGNGNDYIDCISGDPYASVIIGGRGNNKLIGGAWPDTFIIRENPSSFTVINDKYNLSPKKNRIEIVNLGIVGIDNNIDSLDTDGKAVRGTMITLSDGQKVFVDTKTLAAAEIWLVNAPGDIIYGKVKPNYFLVDDKTKVKVNGVLVAFDQLPVSQNGRLLVPVRAIAEAMGYRVSWDGVTNTATVSNNSSTTVKMTIGNPTVAISKNGVNSTITLDVPPQMIGGRTLVPLRALAESFGAKVDWDDKNKTAIITTHAP